MTAARDWDEDDDLDRDDDYDDDPDDDREPDPEDYEINRSYEEYAEHCDAVHGGGECDCRPSLAARALQAARGIGWQAASRTWWPVKRASRHPWTVRIGPAEITLRLRAGRGCGACGGQGWLYTLDRSRADDRPPGYNGASLCDCGSAIGKLAETRRYLRNTDNQPPF